MKNYTVIAKIEVRADDKDAAEQVLRNALEDLYKEGGIGPVAEFTTMEGAHLLDKVYKDIHDMPG